MILELVAEEIIGKIAEGRISRWNHPVGLIVGEVVVQLVVATLAKHYSLIIIDYLSIVIASIQH